MVREIKYTNIKRVLDNLMDHPLLREVTLEQAIRHTLRFISLHGYPALFKDKEETLDVEDFRAMLPCDLISIVQVKDELTGMCLRAMTSTFNPKEPPMPKKEEYQKDEKFLYIPPLKRYAEEPAFKVQGRVLFTSFPDGKVRVAYRAIPIDEEGFPLLIDNEVYLAALEAYIKKQVFTVKFDTGKISGNVLQNAKQEYAFLAGQLREEMKTPSLSEMESISRAWSHVIPRMREFDNGFKNLGDREYLRKH